jgi:hypothetical protein
LSVLHFAQQRLGLLQTRVGAELYDGQHLIVQVAQRLGILDALGHAVQAVGMRGGRLAGDADDVIRQHQRVRYLMTQ